MVDYSAMTYAPLTQNPLLGNLNLSLCYSRAVTRQNINMLIGAIRRCKVQIYSYFLQKSIDILIYLYISVSALASS